MLSIQVSEKLAWHDTPFYIYYMNLLRQNHDSVFWTLSIYNFSIHNRIKD